MKSLLVTDHAGVGKDVDKWFAAYRPHVERAWEVELAGHPHDPTLDLLIFADLDPNDPHALHLTVTYRTDPANVFRPSQSAGRYCGVKNRDAVWVWIRFAGTNDRYLVALEQGRVKH